jgi:L-ribulose-5-phosphate 4-epimerase
LKALITASISEEVLNKLKKLMDITYESWRDTGIIYFNATELLQKLDGYDIFITATDDLKKEEFFEHCKLKLIVTCRGDPFNVNLDAANKIKLPILYTPLRNVDAVAELTVGYIISLARHITALDKFLHSENFSIVDFKDWIKVYNTYMGIEILKKKVGIIGLGEIGRRVAKILLSFGCIILIYDPYLSDEEISEYGEKTDLSTLMRNSDFITIHARATEDNDNLIDEKHIGMMKKSAYILNLAKGSLIDYDALYNALKSKKIAGAALDVFPLEPIDEDNEFLELDNVIVSPHIAGNTEDVIKRQSEILLKDLKAWIKNQSPKNILNPEVLDVKNKRNLIWDEEIIYKKKEIVQLCQSLLNEGHVIGSAGNVSVRIKNEEKEIILITPSNVRYDEMKTEDILVIDLSGNILEGERNPSVEKYLHLNIYHSREDVNAVIHSHGIFSTILSTQKLSLPPIIEELIPYLGGEIECAEYGEAGTEELANNVINSLKEKNAVLLANHGNICCGSHLKGAYMVLKYLERGSKIYYLAKLLKDPNLLPEDTIDYEKDIFELFKESKKI